MLHLASFTLQNWVGLRVGKSPHPNTEKWEVPKTFPEISAACTLPKTNSSRKQSLVSGSRVIPGTSNMGPPYGKLPIPFPYL